MIYVVLRHPEGLTAGTQGKRCQLVCTLTAGCLVGKSERFQCASLGGQTL